MIFPIGGICSSYCPVSKTAHSLAVVILLQAMGLPSCQMYRKVQSLDSGFQCPLQNRHQHMVTTCLRSVSQCQLCRRTSVCSGTSWSKQHTRDGEPLESMNSKPQPLHPRPQTIVAHLLTTTFGSMPRENARGNSTASTIADAQRRLLAVKPWSPAQTIPSHQHKVPADAF